MDTANPCEQLGEVIETADFCCIVNIEYKQGTTDRYLIMNVVKRRRIDTTAGEISSYTYLAHPFQKGNGMRLIDDMKLEQVMSVQSLVTDISDIIGTERQNAVPRLVITDDDDDYDDDFD